MIFVQEGYRADDYPAFPPSDSDDYYGAAPANLCQRLCQPVCQPVSAAVCCGPIRTVQV